MQGIEGVLELSPVRESLPGPSCTACPPNHAPRPSRHRFHAISLKNPAWYGEAHLVCNYIQRSKLKFTTKGHKRHNKLCKFYILTNLVILVDLVIIVIFVNLVILVILMMLVILVNLAILVILDAV